MPVLSQDFYNRDPLVVAPDLLGKILLRRLGNQVVSGRIIEVEAYQGLSDEAAHSFNGKTKRNASLFSGPGHAYVHQIHQQYCLDVVVESPQVPSSVLIRALEPMEGIDLMKQSRGKTKLTDLTSGPGKLTQALQIHKEFDGLDLTTPDSPLMLLDDGTVYSKIATGKRIGISQAQDKPWRFYLSESAYLSRR